jgi:hypothetical protein
MISQPPLVDVGLPFLICLPFFSDGVIGQFFLNIYFLNGRISTRYGRKAIEV